MQGADRVQYCCLLKISRAIFGDHSTVHIEITVHYAVLLDADAYRGPQTIQHHSTGVHTQSSLSFGRSASACHGTALTVRKVCSSEAEATRSHWGQRVFNVAAVGDRREERKEGRKKEGQEGREEGRKVEGRKEKLKRKRG